jgi:hypothetical protein
MSKGAISNGPLSIYQGTETTRDDLLRLLKNINPALEEKRQILPKSLERTFAAFWPELDEKLQAATSLVAQKKTLFRLLSEWMR